MISEKTFTEKDKDELARTPLTSEMSDAKEWIVREDRNPDQLITVFVSPQPNGDLYVACACLRGARDLTCPHALDVLIKCRASDEILVQLSKRGPGDQRAVATYLH